MVVAPRADREEEIRAVADGRYEPTGEAVAALPLNVLARGEQQRRASCRAFLELMCNCAPFDARARSVAFCVDQEGEERHPAHADRAEAVGDVRIVRAAH